MQEGFGGADEQGQRNDALGFIAKLALHFDAAGFIHPVQHALRVKGTGVAAEQHGGGILAPVIAHPGVAHFGNAIFDCFGHLQCIAECAAGEDLDFETSPGELVHFFSECFGADVHQRAAPPSGGHFPVITGALGAGGRRDCKCGGNRSGFQEIALFHLTPPRYDLSDQACRWVSGYLFRLCFSMASLSSGLMCFSL